MKNLAKFIIINLIIACLTISCITTKKEDEKEILKKSKEYIAKENYLEAYNLLKSNKEKLASKSEYWEILGKISISIGKINEATKYYEIALSLENDPEKKEEICIKLAYLYLISNYYIKAEKIAQKILEKDPNNIYANLILGRVDFLKGKTEQLKKRLKNINKKGTKCDTYLEIGDLYLLIKNYKEAIKYYKIAQNLCPQKIETFLALGNAYYFQGDYTETEKYIKEIIKLTKQKSKKTANYLKAYLAEFYIKINKKEKALKIYKELHKKYPKNYFFAIRTIEIAIQNQKLSLAQDILNEIEKDCPDLFYIPYLKGHLYLLQGKTKEASIFFTQAASKEENPQIFYYLGISQWLEGLEYQALINFKKALNLNPAYVEANLAISSLLLKNNEIIEAKRYIEKTINISTKSHLLKTALLIKEKNCLEAQKELAFLKEIGKYQKEVKSLNLSFKANCKGNIEDELELPFQAWIIIKNQTESLSKLKVPENIKLALKIAIEKSEDKKIPDTDYTPILYLKAIKEAKQGEIQKAIKKLEIITKRTPDFGQAWKLLGNLYLQEKKYEKAAHAYRNAINHEEKDPILWNNLAWSSLMSSIKKGEIPEKEALQAAEKAFSLDPKNPAILDTLALVYFYSGMKELACRTMENAINISPEDEIIKKHFQDICTYKNENL